LLKVLYSTPSKMGAQEWWARSEKRKKILFGLRTTGIGGWLINSGSSSTAHLQPVVQPVVDEPVVDELPA
jgi:hypothetical protein